MSPEATAAVVGAAVGGAIGFLTQLGVLAYTRRQERRAAAQLIFAELTRNIAEALTALKTGLWPSTTGLPTTVAWDGYATKLLRGRGVEEVGHVSSAYSALDSLAWLCREVDGFEKNDHSAEVRIIRMGVYEVGRIMGMSDPELEARAVLDDEIRKERAEISELVRSSRPGRWARIRLWLKR